MGLIMSKAPWREALQIKVSTNSNSAKSKGLGEISKTPGPVRKQEPKLDGVYDERTPVHNKVSLKSLKSLDPRSPTVGINRTPILVEDTGSCDTKLNHFDSPVSIYSSNVSNSSIQDVLTPTEPPVNVSGFDESKEEERGLLAVSECTSMTKVSDTLEPLIIKDKPTTCEAKKLLEEIILADENSIKKNYTPVRKHGKVTLRTKSAKIGNNLKVNLLKTRTPLSNITSSANSPSSTVPTGKGFSRSKACAEFGAENVTSPLGSQLVKWDQNNTVII